MKEVASRDAQNICAVTGNSPKLHKDNYIRRHLTFTKKLIFQGSILRSRAPARITYKKSTLISYSINKAFSRNSVPFLCTLPW